MGIYGALSTAVTGLQAQSFALENISGNIANSQTVGYKRVETSFEDMIPDGTPSKQAAGSVVADARATFAPGAMPEVWPRLRPSIEAGTLARPAAVEAVWVPWPSPSRGDR